MKVIRVWIRENLKSQWYFKGRNSKTLGQINYRIGKDGFKGASKVYPFESWENNGINDIEREVGKGKQIKCDSVTTFMAAQKLLELT